VLLLVTFLIPGSAALPGTAFLHEQMKVHHFAGMILIALGGWRSSMGELPRRQLASGGSAASEGHSTLHGVVFAILYLAGRLQPIPL
jgi:hypothetical protein